MSLAREFFMQHLPSEICAQLDLDSLVLRPITFISKKLIKQEADVLLAETAASLPDVVLGERSEHEDPEKHLFII